jgi:hypothetical protein
MEQSKIEVQAEPVKTTSGSTEIKRFAIKAGIITVLLLTLLNLLLPDFDKLKRFETPKTKLILLSFIQNPRALLKISEIEEDEGKLDNAIREMELAVGLLEMHGAGKQIIEPYLARINRLKLQNAQTLPNGGKQ